MRMTPIAGSTFDVDLIFDGDGDSVNRTELFAFFLGLFAFLITLLSSFQRPLKIHIRDVVIANPDINSPADDLSKQLDTREFALKQCILDLM